MEYQKIIRTFKEIIPVKQRAVHIVSDIEKEYNNKFKNYGLVALGMDTTSIKNEINNLTKI